jgi:hypothetical protein
MNGFFWPDLTTAGNYPLLQWGSYPALMFRRVPRWQSRHSRKLHKKKRGETAALPAFAIPDRDR